MTKKKLAKNIRTIKAESDAYGDYQTKTAGVYFQMSPEEKQSLKELAEVLGIPQTVILRRLVYLAIKHHQEGQDILEGFEY